MNRKILDNPIMRKPAYLALWTAILLLAQHKESSFIWNGKKQVLKSGQLLTGRKKLSELTGIKSGTVVNILKYLETEQQIEQQKTTKFTIITIKNWDKYQHQTENEQQSSNKVATDEQQNDTYNNDNNENNDNKKKDVAGATGGSSKKITKRFIKPTLKDIEQQVVKKGFTVSPMAFFSHYESVGWKVGKNQMKNWKAALSGWQTRETKDSTKGAYHGTSEITKQHSKEEQFIR